MPLPRLHQEEEDERDAEPVSAESAEIGKYVYCVIETDREEDFGPLGIGEGNNTVHTVHFQGLAAVVSDTHIRIYDPTRQNVLAHERVNERVMETHTVIPMSFGTIFRTEDDIVELLRSTETAFTDVMNKIKDKIELGLKVLWDRDKVVAKLEMEDEEIGKLREQIESDTKNSTYFARVQLGRLIESGLEEKAGEFVTHVYETLKPVSVASRSNKPFGEHMIMNAAFLVKRDRRPAFDESVKLMSSEYDGLLSFRSNGPWPPYNFVNIKLKLERADL